MEVEADGFLYNMVRNLAGTLVEVGREKKPRNWPSAVLAERDRRVAGMTAPPHGLYLVQVNF
jgi:tRNA pseudouridine38-40 synthase